MKAIEKAYLNALLADIKYTTSESTPATHPSRLR
jgi:hypothetical protein